ncbi:MAG: TPM domain-containing protein, partial [Gammaproteobacteria bacterium]
MKTGLARIWAHLSHDSRVAQRVFPDAALHRIELAVAGGERRHSAEVRVAIEASVPWHRTLRGLTPRERALEVFSELRVWDTEANNGVLLYLLLADHAIEVIADRAAVAAAAQRQVGVHERLPAVLGPGRQVLEQAAGALQPARRHGVVAAEVQPVRGEPHRGARRAGLVARGAVGAIGALA